MIEQLYFHKDHSQNANFASKWYFHDLVHSYLYKAGQDQYKLQESDRIYLAPSEYFMPTWNPASSPWVRKACSKTLMSDEQEKGRRARLRTELCRDLYPKNYTCAPTKDSYTKHYWHNRPVHVASGGIEVEDLIPRVIKANFHGTVLV